MTNQHALYKKEKTTVSDIGFGCLLTQFLSPMASSGPTLVPLATLVSAQAQLCNPPGPTNPVTLPRSSGMLSIPSNALFYYSVGPFGTATAGAMQAPRRDWCACPLVGTALPLKPSLEALLARVPSRTNGIPAAA